MSIPLDETCSTLSIQWAPSTSSSSNRFFFPLLRFKGFISTTCKLRWITIQNCGNRRQCFALSTQRTVVTLFFLKNNDQPSDWLEGLNIHLCVTNAWSGVLGWKFSAYVTSQDAIQVWDERLDNVQSYPYLHGNVTRLTVKCNFNTDDKVLYTVHPSTMASSKYCQMGNTSNILPYPYCFFLPAVCWSFKHPT